MRSLALITGIAFALLAEHVFAQEMGFLGGEGGSAYSFGLEHLYENAPASMPGFRIEEQKGSLSIPVYVEGESSYSLGIRGQRVILGESLRFADRGVDLPEEFGTAELSLAWNKKDSFGNRMGAYASYGHAGRRILDNGLSPIVTLNLFTERLADGGNSWLFFLNYANNRAILNNIPIPGFAYSINGKAGRLMLGIPFIFGFWRPDPFMLSTFLSPFGASAEVAYRFYGPLMVYTNAAWRPKAFQNLVEGSEDRLIFEKKELSLGLRAMFGRQSNISLGYVRNIDRRFLLGRSLRDPNSDTITIPDSDGWQARLKFTF